ncbi:MAG: hypothetical protein SH848_20650 [Saprospiraceae bacterium]|nr:hypothetical protein [Saprospiraceae bacterium]MDZ4706352.1 hypothetical protein [Saprospiraceae bacterium]
MDEPKLIDKEMARVLDLLEQIKALNKMIDMHKNQSKDEFMAHQYEDMKHRFLEELKTILQEYEIEVQIQENAA